MYMLSISERIALPAGNLQEGFRWCERAAASGLARPLFALAAYRLEGKGCPGDDVKAEALLREALLAAKRQGDDALAFDVAEILALKDTAERLDEVRKKLDWHDTDGKPVLALGVLHPNDLKAAAPKPASPPASAGPPSKLVLLDLAMTRSESGNYVSVEGRVRNVSGVPLPQVKTSITYEDKNGRLVATSDAYLKPDPIPAGSFATFRSFDGFKAGMDHVKLEFLSGGDAAVPWSDRSGAKAHQ
jgi:hypothetical protein